MMDDYVYENILFEVVGDHPHKGELCHPVGSSKKTITMNLGMALVESVTKESGIDRFYADKRNLKIIKRDSQ
jgi:hypothetical protein